MISTTRKYLSFIKFSHTVFALPFALIGFSLAIYSGKGEFTWKIFGLVVLCMVFARSAAMAFNRLIDRTYDARNPRTVVREIPSGIISPLAALVMVLVCSAGFVISTYFINTVCFYLSPVALFVVLGYSYTKRFTILCHLVLGAGLALAPIGAYVAVAGVFDILPLTFSAIVFFWVSGFDIIYALQDDEFDRSEELKSIPAFFGRKRALHLSQVLHVLAALLVTCAYFYGSFGWLYLVGALAFTGLLVYQHALVKPHDLSRVNLAFGTTNGIASIIFCVCVCADIFLI